MSHIKEFLLRHLLWLFEISLELNWVTFREDSSTIHNENLSKDAFGNGASRGSSSRDSFRKQHADGRKDHSRLFRLLRPLLRILLYCPTDSVVVNEKEEEEIYNFKLTASSLSLLIKISHKKRRNLFKWTSLRASFLERYGLKFIATQLIIESIQTMSTCTIIISAA